MHTRVHCDQPCSLSPDHPLVVQQRRTNAFVWVCASSIPTTTTYATLVVLLCDHELSITEVEHNHDDRRVVDDSPANQGDQLKRSARAGTLHGSFVLDTCVAPRPPTGPTPTHVAHTRTRHTHAPVTMCHRAHEVDCFVEVATSLAHVQ